MNVFSARSGDKDCMLALHRTLTEGEHNLLALLNMCDRDTNFSRSHGLKKELLQRQAEAMGVRLVQQETSRSDYEKNLKSATVELKKEGVETIFPLWGGPTNLVDVGFEPLVVPVHARHLPESFLGRTFDKSYINDLKQIEGTDICAENGEFHSFVVNGPIFRYPVKYESGKTYFRDDHWFLELN